MLPPYFKGHHPLDFNISNLKQMYTPTILIPML